MTASVFGAGGVLRESSQGNVNRKFWDCRQQVETHCVLSSSGCKLSRISSLASTLHQRDFNDNTKGDEKIGRNLFCDSDPAVDSRKLAAKSPPFRRA
jgi:hypothetical protein